MTYSGAHGEYHDWEKISDIRTVFWVVRKKSTDSNRFLLGDWTGSGSSGDYNFHAAGNNYLHSGHAKYGLCGNAERKWSVELQILEDPSA